VAATTVTTAKKKTTTRYDDSDANNKTSNEPILPYKRERQKINSLARVLQIENALYADHMAMRFAAISDQINNVDKRIESLRLDMQAAIHNEFMYLVQKMLLTRSKQRAENM
jgi:hypothetical protein